MRNFKQGDASQLKGPRILERAWSPTERAPENMLDFLSPGRFPADWHRRFPSIARLSKAYQVHVDYEMCGEGC
ncbi:hypothetical protein [Burkholderia sp. 22PA0106]|uniref:hypothetical protein n=1 Tax=Burkholderia sp. 22PA0106 TaxID=3237371 RepID=UPI0039C0EA99